jgi:ribosome-binding protein aMBF1 (putative translation factor)
MLRRDDGGGSGELRFAGILEAAKETKMSYSALGAAIAQARESAGLSVAELAVRADFPMNRLMQLESGWITPMVGELECLAAELGPAGAALLAQADQAADRR